MDRKDLDKIMVDIDDRISEVVFVYNALEKCSDIGQKLLAHDCLKDMASVYLREEIYNLLDLQVCIEESKKQANGSK